MVALVGALFGMHATAGTLQPVAAVDITHENNLFRLSDDEVRLMEAQGDTYRTALGGLRFEGLAGRQALSGRAELTSVKFDRNGQLDYVGKHLSGEWHWFIGAHFEGHIGGSSVKVLAPFSDFHSEERNLRVTRKQYADGSWRFHSRWQWHTSYTKDDYVYELQSQRANDRTDEAVMTGIDYLAASGSTIGLQLRRLKGRYPFGQSFGTGFPDNSYVQNEAKLNVLWLATGHTQVLFLGGWTQRKQNTDVERVDSGTNARLIVNWMPAKQIKLVGQGWREFAAIDGTLLDSALITGASTEATWDHSEKIQSMFNLRRETRDFSPSRSAAVSALSGLLSDRITTASVGLIYKPLRNFALKLNMFREQRAGSVVAGSNTYKASGASFNASVQF